LNELTKVEIELLWPPRVPARVRINEFIVKDFLLLPLSTLPQPSPIKSLTQFLLPIILGKEWHSLSYI
jgi:hypothetical protein